MLSNLQNCAVESVSGRIELGTLLVAGRERWKKFLLQQFHSAVSLAAAQEDITDSARKIGELPVITELKNGTTRK